LPPTLKKEYVGHGKLKKVSKNLENQLSNNEVICKTVGETIAMDIPE